MSSGFFIGIDQSFRGAGIVLLDSDGNIVNFKLVKTSKKDSEDKFVRACMIAEGIIDFIKNSPPDTPISMEGLAFGGVGNATRDLAGLLYCIQTHLKLVLNKSVHTLFSPQTIKKIAAGKGSIKGKDAIILATPVDVCEKFIESGARKTTGLADLVDAYWIARALREEITKSTNTA